jgi:hypothetical protein
MYLAGVGYYVRLASVNHRNGALVAIRAMRATNLRAALWRVILLAPLAGCTEIDRQQLPPAAIEGSATDAWLGRWTGPEGTYLQISGAGGHYELTIADLDGPRSFRGQAQEDGIVFERNGVREVVRATDGVGTGMKWLVDQSNCLVIAPSEGFCRP